MSDKRPMTQEQLDAEIARLRAEADKREADRRAAREAEDRAKTERFQRERTERIEAELKSAARMSWGGTEAEFEREWPTMRVEMLRKRTIADAEAARSRFADQVRNFFS
jgi:multidrug efflux pump subunit AcrA (membrane-fusion protein)